MPACNFTDFDIFIQGDAPPYAVTASYAGQHAVGQLTAGMDDPAWRIDHITLAESMTISDEAGIAQVGKRLWQALFQGDIRDLWIAARTDSEACARRRYPAAARHPAGSGGCALLGSTL